MIEQQDNLEVKTNGLYQGLQVDKKEGLNFCAGHQNYFSGAGYKRGNVLYCTESCYQLNMLHD